MSAKGGRKMFCKNCGAKIEGNSNFCSVCGSDLVTRRKEGDGKTLLVSETKIKKRSMAVIICGCLVACGGIFFLFSALSTEVSVFSPTQEAQRNQNIIAALFFIGVGIMFYYEGMKWAAMKITICENMVYGSYGFGASKQFKLTYNEIVKVTASENGIGNNIVIESKTKTYMLINMENVEEAAKLINDRINE